MTVLEDIAIDLNTHFRSGVSFKYHADAKELTTFCLGGPIGFLVQPQEVSVLQDVVSYLNYRSLPWKVLGAGSNILINDNGIAQVVIKLSSELSSFHIVPRSDSPLSSTELRELSRKPSPSEEELAASSESELRVLVFGACPLIGLSRRTTAAGFAGLEFAAGIPASLGGAVTMNAGAHGSSMSNVIKRVYVLEKEGLLKAYSASELSFAYRSSAIGANMVVLAAELGLQAGDREEIIARRISALDYRKRTQPLNLPSAGSVFVNPEPGVYAAELLQGAGLKGKRKGGVCFSTLHSNWIVKNSEQGRSEDVCSLMALAVDRVFDKYGLSLESEIHLW